MKLAFISDLHLSENTSTKNHLFYSLIEKWKNELDALYILGDFFDFWCGDDDDNAFIRETKLSLKSFSQKNPIYFITGNHDFGIGKKFAKETGISIIKDLSTIKIANNTILLSHGDVFCSLDISHQRMKIILQNPLVIFVLRHLPLSWRYKIKAKLEHKSSQQFNSKPQKTYLVVDETIIKLASKCMANIVIHGHTHKPNVYEIKTSYGNISRFEIPDWKDNQPGGYIMLEDNLITIHYAT